MYEVYNKYKTILSNFIYYSLTHKLSEMFKTIKLLKKWKDIVIFLKCHFFYVYFSFTPCYAWGEPLVCAKTWKGPVMCGITVKNFRWHCRHIEALIVLTLTPLSGSKVELSKWIFSIFRLCTLSLSPCCLGCQGVWWLMLVIGSQAWALDGRFGCWAAQLGKAWLILAIEFVLVWLHNHSWLFKKSKFIHSLIA